MTNLSVTFQVLQGTELFCEDEWRRTAEGGPDDHTRNPVFYWVELNEVGKAPTGRQLLLAF